MRLALAMLTVAIATFSWWQLTPSKETVSDNQANPQEHQNSVGTPPPPVSTAAVNKSSKKAPAKVTRLAAKALPIKSSPEQSAKRLNWDRTDNIEEELYGTANRKKKKTKVYEPTIDIKDSPLTRELRAKAPKPKTKVAYVQQDFSSGMIRLGKSYVDISAPCQPNIPRKCVSRKPVRVCPDVSDKSDSVCEIREKRFASCSNDNPNVENADAACWQRKIRSANSCQDEAVGSFLFCTENTEDADDVSTSCFLADNPLYKQKTGVNPKTKHYYNQCDRPLSSRDLAKLRKSSSRNSLTKSIRGICKGRTAVVIKRDEQSLGTPEQAIACRPHMRQL